MLIIQARVFHQNKIDVKTLILDWEILLQVETMKRFDDEDFEYFEVDEEHGTLDHMDDEDSIKI